MLKYNTVQWWPEGHKYHQVLAQRLLTYWTYLTFQGIHTVQNFLRKRYAQKNKPDSLLCTAISGFSGNFGRTLVLWPRVILGYLRQP